MPIPSYSGKTCVAFLDISGFKKMMERGIKAESALNKFYNTVFRSVGEFNSPRLDTIKIRSLVVSDCAVIFIDNMHMRENGMRDLRATLKFIQRVNRALTNPHPNPSIMTTCSIDYGRFKYQDRIEFEGIGKDYFFGEPYVNAFLDNEKLKNKPGFCRVLRKNLQISDDNRRTHPFSLLEREGSFNYFYWMLDSLNALERFKREYENVLQSIYTELTSLLQSFRRNLGNACASVQFADDKDSQI